MKHVKRYYFFILLALPMLLHNGCTKEYSFEGAPYDTLAVNDSIPADTVIPSTPLLPQCSFCNGADEIVTGQWSFKTGGCYCCGSFTNSGFIGGSSKTAFTFFGPSACSIDTGIVVSVYLPVALDQDRFGLAASSSAFYYYDHNATKDILISQPIIPFTVTIDSFIYATGIVKGSFSGTVFTANGDTAYITEGRFIAPLY